MNRKPLIGISVYLAEVDWGPWTKRPVTLLPARYLELVKQAGGHALLLPPDVPESAPELLAPLDALVISGGHDVNPALYGEPAGPHTGEPVNDRDAWEAALLRAALAAELPLLGICRGMQLLNVVCGGTLHQHLPDLDRPGHVGAAPGEYGSHLVRPLPGTLLAGLLPEPALDVPTQHHQAVDRLGEGLRVGALAEDGTVEAVEGTGFTLGVQWHPEQGEDLRVMRALVAAAQARQSGTTTVTSAAFGSSYDLGFTSGVDH